jgi:hypothetical protein
VRLSATPGRWGEKLGAAQDPDNRRNPHRAGFEPFRGRGKLYQAELALLKTDRAFMESGQGGACPERLKTGAEYREGATLPWARRVFGPARQGVR